MNGDTPKNGKPRRKRTRPKLVPIPLHPGDAPLGRGRKLTNDAQAFVVSQLAQFVPHETVVLRLADEPFRVHVSRQNIDKFAVKHAQQVQLAREDYMRELCNTPLAFKRYRLEQLQQIYETCADADVADRLDILKAAAAEMRGPDLVAIILGHRRDEDEATEFLRDPRFQVGAIDVDRILRRRELQAPERVPMPGTEKKKP